MTEVLWSDTAFDQLDAVGACIEQFNPKAAAEVAAALLAAASTNDLGPHGMPAAAEATKELLTQMQDDAR